MTMTPGEGSGSIPTTDTGVCSITPSDLVGYTGNALNRIKELEQRVSELEAKIVQANQLSDLSQQVGWVGGVTYMGVDGWTQTEYGTLIPPAGVSLSSLGITIPNVGTPQQMVIMDANGNLVFGAGTDGTLSGSLSGEMDYAIFSYSTTSGTVINTSRNITVTPSIDSTPEVTMTVSKAGAYLASVAAGKSQGAGHYQRVGATATTSGGQSLGQTLIADYLTTGVIAGFSGCDSRLVTMSASETITASIISDIIAVGETRELNLSLVRLTSI